MFCKRCGKEISDKAAVCVGCGATVDAPASVQEDHAGAGWWWLGFFVPVAGLLIWIFCHDTQPKRSKKAGVGAIIGTVAAVVAYILFWVIWCLFMFLLMDGMYTYI